MRQSENKQARFSEDYKYIYDSDGNKVLYDDPRVVHVWPIDTSETTSHLMGSVFKKRGWNFRFSGGTNTEIMQYSKKLCSGRECLPCASLTGSTYRDIVEKRSKDEITIYYNLDQDGPCQDGAWPVIWDTFAKRLNLRNVVFLANPSLKNNFLGQGDFFATEMAIAGVVGDLLDEAETTVRCLAQDRGKAMELFHAETQNIIKSFETGLKPLEKALKKFVKKTSKIKLKATVAETPKVLLFGGLNVMFIHPPITEFFEERGIITKVVDFCEGLAWITSEYVTRYGVQRGLMVPKEQFNIRSTFLSFLNPKNYNKVAFNGFKSRLHLAGFDFFMKKYRKIVQKSGLLYDTHIPFIKLAETGHKYVSTNGFNETAITTGRFICSINDGVFDGLINVDSFNCQPAMNAQATLRPLANKADIPFAAVDCEGPWISANQKRLLDTIAVQAKRVRKEKNKR